jgi:dienelactone hydrolase
MTCCPTNVKPIAADPSFKGAGTFGPNQSYYYVEPASQTPLEGRILVIPDIFGFHPVAMAIWDSLAQKLNVAVLVPDFFDGQPWDLAKMPPNMAEFGPFLQRVSYENILPRIEAGAKKLTELSAARLRDGAKGVVVVGFCWGAKAACRLNAEQPWVAGTALIHPSFMNVEDGRKMKKPVLLCPSKDDTPMEDIKAAIEATGHLVGYLYADDVHHGYCGARSNSTPEVQKRIEETFALLPTLL